MSFGALKSDDPSPALCSYHIGTLEKTADLSPKTDDDALKVIDPVFLQKTKWKKTRLLSITQVSPDSKVFRFALEKDDQPLGLPTGHHVFVRSRSADGELVQRAYTPVSRQSEVGFIDLLIKLYLPNKSYPLGGRMSG